MAQKIQYECDACGFPVSLPYVKATGKCVQCGAELETPPSSITEGSSFSAGSWVFGLFVGIVLSPLFKELAEAGKRAATRIK